MKFCRLMKQGNKVMTVAEHRLKGADLPARGKTLCVEAGDTEILLCHTAEGFFAVANLCTHAAARLCDGKLKGHRILCPLHGAAFDVRDGAALTRPASIALASYEVRMDAEDVVIVVEQPVAAG
jgi:nitrite reductase/ring-hydroxylating ferredoxin subunit